MEAEFCESGEEEFDVDEVFFHRFGGDEKIVEVTENEREIAKNMVHISLPGLRCVSQPEIHPFELVGAKGGENRRFRDVFLADFAVEESSSEIECAVNCGPEEGRCEVV